MLKNRGVTGLVKRPLFVVLLLMSCVCGPGAWASDRKMEAALKRQYHDRTLTLRHPLLSGTQQYDATGKLLSPGPEGAWTLYSGMTIRKISLQADKLLLEGHRMYFLYARQTAISYVPDKNSPMKVEVLLEHPCASVKEATAIMEAIFAVRDEDLLEIVPIYWKPFLARSAGLKKEAKTNPSGQLQPGLIMPRPI